MSDALKLETTSRYDMKTKPLFAALLAFALFGCGGGSQDAQPQAADGAAAANDGAAETIEASNARLVEDLPTYESKPLPEGLVWETNTDDEAFASPNAKRGGEFRTSMLSFPLTLRTFGPDANGGFANYLRAGQMQLIGLHPNTLKYIPMLAREWAFDPDGKTVYYRLDREAHWSDGLPVTADDFVFTLNMMRSKFIVDPWSNNNYTNNIVDVVKHDEYTFSIVGASPKPREEIMVEYGFGPEPRQFHKLDENGSRVSRRANSSSSSVSRIGGATTASTSRNATTPRRCAST